MLAVGDVNLTELSSIGGPPKTERGVTTIAAERANEFADAAEDYGLETSAVVQSGTPATEIVDYAEEIDATAIVIVTAGRTDWKNGFSAT